MLDTVEFKSLSVNGSKSLFGYRIDPGELHHSMVVFEQAACHQYTKGRV